MSADISTNGVIPTYTSQVLLLVFGFGDETVDAEALDRRDLEIERRRRFVGVVDLGQRRVQVDDPLVEGRRQRTRRGCLGWSCRRRGGRRSRRFGNWRGRRRGG